MNNNTFYDHFDTPLGKMEIAAADDAVLSILFCDKLNKVNRNGITDIAKKQVLQYFDGDRREFDMPMRLQGTPFQQSVWRALTNVPYAETCSYAEIATNINNRKAVRAVGAANGKNPMTIVVPCHRIVGSNGSLTGYAFGLEHKAWLLEHEIKNAA